MEDLLRQLVGPWAASNTAIWLPASSVLQWGLVVVCGAWLLLRFAVWRRKASLGLRALERAPNHDLGEPNYRAGMDARREALRERSDKYEADRARAAELPPEAGPCPDEGVDDWTKWLSVARVGTLVLAGLNLGMTIVAAVAAGGDVNEMVEAISLSDRWEVVLEKYWVGLFVAAVIIVLEVGRWIRQRRSPSLTNSRNHE